jgi:hypothetical protein
VPLPAFVVNKNYPKRTQLTGTVIADLAFRVVANREDGIRDTDLSATIFFCKRTQFPQRKHAQTLLTKALVIIHSTIYIRKTNPIKPNRQHPHEQLSPFSRASTATLGGGIMSSGICCIHNSKLRNQN